MHTGSQCEVAGLTPNGRMHIVDNVNRKVIVTRSDIDQEETRNYTMNLSKNQHIRRCSYGP